MRAQHEQEFSEYADARWPVLVRAAVVLGCSLEEAQDLAQTTLLRCLRAWTRVRAADDRDAYVYTVLLNAHRDSHRRRWRGERPTAEVPDSHVADRSAEVDLTDAVHRALADLSADHPKVKTRMVKAWIEFKATLPTR